MKMNETSFYVWQHDECNDVKIKMNLEKDNLFRVRFSAKANFSGFADDDVDPEMPIEIDTVVPFTGFTIRQETFSPRPSNEEEAVNVASEFIDPTSFHAPTFEDGVFSFEPKL